MSDPVSQSGQGQGGQNDQEQIVCCNTAQIQLILHIRVGYQQFCVIKYWLENVHKIYWLRNNQPPRPGATRFTVCLHHSRVMIASVHMTSSLLQHPNWHFNYNKLSWYELYTHVRLCIITEQLFDSYAAMIRNRTL